MVGVFTKNVFGSLSVNNGSNDEGGGDDDGNERNKQMKNNKFCRSSALYFTTCTNTTVNFLLRRCLENELGRKNRDKFNFFSESEIGCSPQDSVGRFTFICHFKRVDGNKREKVLKKNKQKKSAFI